MSTQSGTLRLKKLGIDTYKEAVIYMSKASEISLSEGFLAQARVEITLRDKTIIATLNIIDSDLLRIDEASLCNYAWELLGEQEGDLISITHPKHL